MAPLSLSARLLLKRVEVSGLFGRYDYAIPPRGRSVGGDGRLLVIYGDNGSGKTTILRLVFHLLSPAQNRGHRSHLARTPFRRLAVELVDGTRVVAERDEAATGSFTMSVHQRPRREETEAYLQIDAEGAVPATVDEDRNARALWEALSEIGMQLYFLADDRSVTSDLMPADEEDEYRRRLLHGPTLPDRRNEALQEAIGRAVSAIQSRALSDASAGVTNANSIYSEVVRRIVECREGGRQTGQAAVHELEARL